ncbi:hypothetical protein ACW4TU_02835 [Streptomyces sp. QTS52]
MIAEAAACGQVDLDLAGVDSTVARASSRDGEFGVAGTVARITGGRDRSRCGG